MGKVAQKKRLRRKERRILDLPEAMIPGPMNDKLTNDER